MRFKKRTGSRRSLSRTLSEAWKIASTARDQDKPLLVHIVPMRRCNLACTYCNEYDDVSPPVPLDTMFKRIDKLAELGTAVVTISGGEPLLHPDLDAIIARIRQRGMVCTLITNGYLLVPKRIKELNAAGLDRLQISIDNVKPDDVSKKSLKVLDRKLQYLAEHARFEININSVVGSKVTCPEDALAIAERARELGFSATLGVIHDDHGHLQPLQPKEMKVVETFQRLTRFSLTRFNRTFQNNLMQGKPNSWKCRAGSRYLYICEDGLVHYCSQQRGYPGIPLEDYSVQHIRREHVRTKGCAPYCTIACVHQASAFDRFRSPQSTSETYSADLITLRKKDSTLSLQA